MPPTWQQKAFLTTARAIERCLRQRCCCPGEHVYGILTVVNEGEDLQQQVLDRGLYFARIHDDVFALAVPEGFEPKSYGA